MSEVKIKLNTIIIVVACFIGSVVLFFLGILIGIANWQSDLVPGFLISWGLSLVLLISGATILIRARRRPTKKD